jgi:PAS domain S-box-containing protein
MATILIVDDRPANRELLVTLLGYFGHRLLEAADGEQGLIVARAEPPDLIITDIVMPKMDGYEFARQVRADASIGQTQIIFYTSSYILEETRRLATACGVSLVIGKPIEPEIFLETVKAALDNNQVPVVAPVPDEFHHEHMRLLTDTLVKKVEELEAEIVERKQAEAALRENEERYRIIFGLTNDYAYKNRIEPDGSIFVEWISEGVTHITGYSLAEARSPDFFMKLIHQDDFPILILHTKQIISGKADVVEVRILTKSGEIHWLRNSAYPIWDANEKRVVIFYGAAEDITKRKWAEQALSDSERHYRKIIETAQEGVWTIDSENRTTLVNQRLADMLGYTVEEMLGKSVYAFLDEDAKVIAAKSLENRRQGINEQLDFKYIRKDGTALWAITETSSLLDRNGNYVGALAMLTDITERKRANEAMKLAYSQLANLHNNLPQAIFSLDVVQNKMLQVSPAHEIIFGHPVDGFFKNPQLWYEMIIPEDKPGIDAGYPGLLAGKTVEFQYRILRPDGKMRWIEAIVKPNQDQSGKTVRFDGIVSDITERKQTEVETHQHLSELEVLYQSGLTLSQLLNPKAIAQKMIDLLDEEMDWHHTTIRLYDPQSQRVELLAFNTPRLKTEEDRSMVEEQFKMRVTNIDQGFSGWVIKHGEIVRSNDL